VLWRAYLSCATGHPPRATASPAHERARQLCEIGHPVHGKGSPPRGMSRLTAMASVASLALYDGSSMPTVFRSGRYRFFFFSNEGTEPVHIHVEAGDGYAKLWLEPVGFAEVHRFNGKEMREVLELVRQRKDEIIEAWNEHFGRQS